MSAVLFGSISTLADTSELQREAFNEAFRQHGLDWHWDRDAYVAMLETSGGRDRIAEYARSRGEDVDAAAVHAIKSELFRTSLAGSGVTPRDGVAETVREARRAGLSVGLVTTTSPDNVAALLAALAPALSAEDFDVVVDSASVEHPKPEPDAYTYALGRLGAQPADCVAVEDNLGGVASARAAGIACLAFPNRNTEGHDFGTTPRLSALDLARLREAIPAH